MVSATYMQRVHHPLSRILMPHTHNFFNDTNIIVFVMLCSLCTKETKRSNTVGKNIGFLLFEVRLYSAERIINRTLRSHCQFVKMWRLGTLLK
jgi:hypothetical protein